MSNPVTLCRSRWAVDFRPALGTSKSPFVPALLCIEYGREGPRRLPDGALFRE
jgi:hypothetical protein